MLLLPMLALSQEKQSLSLNDVIAIAQSSSPSAIQAKNKFKNSYWQYRVYESTTLPALSFEATAPSYSRAIDRIPTTEGDIFVERRFSTSSANFNLSQNIGFTGGNIFMTSGLQYLEIYGTSFQHSYVSTPVSIGFSQPLFTYNSFRWARKIEPLVYKEAKKQYVEDMESISITATNAFFDLLAAQISLQTELLNQRNNDTLYNIAKGRYNLGKIAENELLQMELNKLNADNAVAQATLDVEVKTLQLKSFLGMKNAEKIDLAPASKISFFAVDLQKAQSRALENRAAVVDFTVKKLEAQRDIARARHENRFALNLFGKYGLTKTATYFDDVYLNPLNLQQAVVGMQLPLIDWGKAKARIQTALASQQLINAQVDQAQSDFEQEIFVKVMQFNMQKEKIGVAAKADTVGQKRFEISKQRYLIGKIDITELTIAQSQKDAARKAWYEALRNYWVNFFEIRKLTHYDFQSDKPIDYAAEVK